MSNTIHVCTYNICNAKFTRRFDLEEHLKRHSDERPFVCMEDDCDKTFKIAYHLRRHLESHEKNIQEYKCTFKDCKARFYRSSKLESHQKKHTCERPFVCNEENCNKSYKNEYHLRRHKSQTHQKNKDVHKCKVPGCNSEFLDLYNLNRHKRTVHGTPNYVCVICNEKFHKKRKLRSHMLEHTGNLKCIYCSAEFKTITEYTKHKNHHKTYTCSCGEVFLKWTVYLKHRRTVHAKYPCPVCKKQFVFQSHLKIHMETHEQVRKILECPMENCERLFYFKRNLAAHIKTYHLKIKAPLPPSKEKIKILNAERGRKPPKTLETGRKPRKDKNMERGMVKSSAVQLAGLIVPHDAEKAIVEEKDVVFEISDDSSVYSDCEQKIKRMRRDTMSDSDSSSARMIPVC